MLYTLSMVRHKSQTAEDAAASVTGTDTAAADIARNAERAPDEIFPRLRMRADCLRISSENREKIDALFVPSTMKSKVKYLLDTQPHHTWLSAIHGVRIDYFLTYHKVTDEISFKYGNTDYKVRNIPEGYFEIYRGDMKKPFKTIRRMAELQRLKLDAKELALIRQQIFTVSDPEEEDVYRQIADEILEVVTIRRWHGRRPSEMFISCMQAATSRENRGFLNHAYLPLDQLAGNIAPELLILDIGQNPVIHRSSRADGNDEAIDYVEIPGEINFEVFQKNFFAYRTSTVPAIDFLKANRTFARDAEKYNIQANVIAANNLLVLKRSGNALSEIFRNFMSAFRDPKNSSFSWQVRGNAAGSIGAGLAEGAILLPITRMMDEKFQLLVFSMVFFRCIYPNLLSIVDITSAARFDSIKDAEKSRRVERAKIHNEIRTVQQRVATYVVIALGILVLLYPGFFTRLFGDHAWTGMVLFMLYFLNQLFMDAAAYFGDDNWFRILKGTIGNDQQHRKNLLKIKSFEKGLRTIANVAGFAAGWALMSVNTAAGLSVAAIGVLTASIAGFLFPYFGADSECILYTNFEPQDLDDNNLAFIPLKARLASRRQVNFYQASRRKWWTPFDPQAMQIIIDRADENAIPVIREIRPFLFANFYRRWKLSWSDGKQVVIALKNARAFSLEQVKEGRKIILMMRDNAVKCGSIK